MAGHAGVPTHKTRNRLDYILKNFDELLPLATPIEQQVMYAIKATGTYATTQHIGDAAGYSKSVAQTTITRLIGLKLLPKLFVDDKLLFVNKTVEEPYTIITEPISGKQYVPLEEVKQFVEQQKIADQDALPPIQATIQSVTFAKNSSRNLVAITVYLPNSDDLTLADLFDQLGVGDVIGITPA